MQKSSTCEQPHEDPNIRYLGMNRPRPGRFLTTKDDGPANYELRLGVMSKTLEIPSSTTGVIDIDVVVNGDRRESPRRDCHTLVTAVTPESPEEPNGWRAVKVRSEDVSVSGAKLVSTQPLSGQQVYLRFLLPNFGKQFVEAVIVNQSIRERVSMTGEVTRLFVYGVKFINVVTDETLIEPLNELTNVAAVG